MFEVAKILERIVLCFSVVTHTLNIFFGLMLLLKENSLMRRQKYLQFGRHLIVQGSNSNARTMCEICSNLTIEALERCQ